MSSKSLQQEILFIRGVVRTDHGELSVMRLQFVKLFATAANACAQETGFNWPPTRTSGDVSAIRMLVEIETVASFHAKEFTVDPGAVAIVGAHNLAIANTERRLATVGAMRADGTHMLHLPGAGFVAISAAGKCANRTDIDAGAAFVALQMIASIRNNLRSCAAIANAQGITPKPSPQIRTQR